MDCILLISSGDIGALRDALVEIALKHPKIGIEQAQVPKSFESLLRKIQKIKDKSYLKWGEYEILGSTFDIYTLLALCFAL